MTDTPPSKKKDDINDMNHTSDTNANNTKQSRNTTAITNASTNGNGHRAATAITSTATATIVTPVASSSLPSSIVAHDDHNDAVTAE